LIVPCCSQTRVAFWVRAPVDADSKERQKLVGNLPFPCAVFEGPETLFFGALFSAANITFVAFYSPTAYVLSRFFSASRQDSASNPLSLISSVPPHGDAFVTSFFCRTLIHTSAPPFSLFFPVPLLPRAIETSFLAEALFPSCRLRPHPPSSLRFPIFRACLSGSHFPPEALIGRVPTFVQPSFKSRMIPRTSS